MKREAMTLGLTVAFAFSLAGTSKAPPAGGTDGAPASAAAAPSGEPAAAGPTATLPDSEGWKPYAFAPGKLAAKLPPSATLQCTNENSILVCVLMRGQKLLGTFSSGGASFAEMRRELKGRKKGAKVLFDERDGIVVHRDDPALGSYCEYVAQGGVQELRSVFAWTEGMDPAAFKMIALRDEDCLDAVAFARTLKRAP